MKQFVVIGLGRFGSSLARNLADKGYHVLAIDYDIERVEKISDYVNYAVEADATDKEALDALGVSEFDVAVVSIGANIQANIVATMILKEMGIPSVIAKAQNELYGRVLNKVGADKVVYPERNMGEKIAQNLLSANVFDYIRYDSDYSVVEIIATEEMVGKTLKDLELRSKYNINVMAVKREDDLILSPGADIKFNENDILIVLGRNKDINKVEKLNKN
ncbi:MAG: potassium channel family protein, partial [Bacillota bacterium]